MTIMQKLKKEIIVLHDNAGWRMPIFIEYCIYHFIFIRNIEKHYIDRKLIIEMSSELIYSLYKCQIYRKNKPFPSFIAQISLGIDSLKGSSNRSLTF